MSFAIIISCTFGQELYIFNWNHMDLKTMNMQHIHMHLSGIQKLNLEWKRGMGKIDNNLTKEQKQPKATNGPSKQRGNLSPGSMY